MSGDALAPAARHGELVVDEDGSEAVIYDLARDHFHHLNDVAVAVWRLCDGETRISTMAGEASVMLGRSVDERIVRMALTKLEDAGLLDAPLPVEVRLAAMDRRRFLRRSAGSAALPVIVSLSAPMAAAAASSRCVERGNACMSDEECCGSDVCNKPDVRFEGFCFFF